ncbi:heme exporter protein CcmD [Anianabacter salinae]|uniref:heme exporter protein CcmD n=1 Tax=Anianabacter salinae TaxID=2851023 RepID=UPI00225DDEAE|nr:heme exporter protein CcmD [Anianabacter salinae]MBV0912899.1 heme exporter protein CcmD [Anianabacter salinae]
MMLDLGKYAGTVLSAYGVSLALLAVIALASWRGAVRSRARLAEAEARKAARNG